jgi:AAA domain
MPTSAFMPIPKKGREGHEGHSEGNGREWEGVLLSEVKIEPLRWLWPGRIPLGKVVSLDGDPGLGKSLISLDLAARVSTGRGTPLALEGEAGELEGEAHGVVLLSAEDGLADTIAPLLLAAGLTAHGLLRCERCALWTPPRECSLRADGCCHATSRSWLAPSSRCRLGSW